MKILIVDDNKDNLYMLESLLRGSGFEVETADDGKKALEKARQDDFDMIISDILMPRMDGFQLCREIKKDDRLKKIPFVFYTAAYTDSKDKEFGLSLGADRYIIKPTEPEVFIETIRELFAEKGRSAEASTTSSLVKEESVFLKEYNERLVKKLEDKMLELEKANKALKASEELYKKLIENANDGVVVIEESGHISFANSKFFEVTGYSRNELKDLQVINLVHPEDRNLVLGTMKKRLAGERCPENYEARVLSKGGETIYVDINASLIKNKDGTSSILAFLRDITDQKRINKELKKSLEELRKIMDGVIHAMALTVETRDPYTAGHQRRVAKISRAIAEEMGLGNEKVEEIYTSAVIHDIGKISVPAEILVKPGRITEIEFSLIKTHCQVGYEIIKNIEFRWPIAEIVLQHHERLDGSGYPARLSGDDILLEARIIAVADVIEAMASHRPYRPALGIEKALEEISRNKGILYDPDVVDASLALFEKGFSLG
ncbi:response regulator [Dissulfuribacter thermophilus]|uniref:Response regulator n=1 Tax=Dissulfuribacter thermophilus TaxID=1156395 RepID=A0A1B9F3N3_9BACT|nr:HD domain-containing phosphohydrolase [Dissulfuribacter thermophilus]OCC14473.1 response regulator [Dissulfuribacter thermophilus]